MSTTRSCRARSRRRSRPSPGWWDVFSLLTFTATGAVTCWADNGLSVPANLHTIPATHPGGDPTRWSGAQYCDMPTGSRLDSDPFSFYQVRPQDYQQPGHILGDIASYKAHDLCESGVNCPTQPLSVSPNSNTTVILRDALLDTFIHVGNDHTDGSPNGPGNPQMAPTGSSGA